MNTNTQGITEQDIADFLANTPGFFERHAELLATVQLSHPHDGRAVSLQQRQADMLREKIKGLEFKILEMIRNGQENVAIADRLHNEIATIMSDPETRKKVLDMGLIEMNIPRNKVRDFVTGELAKWKKVILDAQVPIN